MVKISNIYKHRNIWMGLAICWVIYFHLVLPIKETVLGTVLLWIKQIGFGGVDIFFLASGVGCFFSYEKSRNAYDFLKRRCIRILPSYLIVAVIWQIYVFWKDEFSILGCLGTLFGVSNFIAAGGGINWYITAMWVSYLLTPIFVDMVKKADDVKRDIANILFIMLLSVPFWHTPLLIISITRLPVFYIGMAMARDGKSDKIVSFKEIICSMIFSIIGIIMLFFFKSKYSDAILWNYGLYWYPFILITPGLCIGISIFFSWLEKFKIGKCVNKAIGIIGNNTFEIFLVHVVLFDVYVRLRNQGVPMHLWRYNIAVMIITAIISYMLCLVRKGILRIIDSKSAR